MVTLEELLSFKAQVGKSERPGCVTSLAFKEGWQEEKVCDAVFYGLPQAK